MFLVLSLGLLATPLLVFSFAFLKYLIRDTKSSLRKHPGPPSRSWFYGNAKYIFERGQSVAWDEWMATYGKTFQYPTMFNVRFLSFYSRLGLELTFRSPLPCLPPIPGP
jgi:hypothetical protein